MKYTAGIVTGLILYFTLERTPKWRRLMWWAFTRDQRDGWFR